MKRVLRLTALGLLAAQLVSAQTTLTATVTPSEITVGDPVTIELRLTPEQPLLGPPRFPVWEEHWGDSEILAVSEPFADAQGEGREAWVQTLTVTVFETGFATLPVARVEVPAPGGTESVALANPIVVEVRSVLPDDAEARSPLPPEPPRALPLGDSFWLAFAVLGLLASALVALLWRQIRRVQQAIASLSLSPAEAFANAARKLRREANPLGIYTGLSLELRRYLGRSFGFPAAEGTTTEIRRQLQRRALPGELSRQTLEFLGEADRVKFARAETGPRRAEATLDAALGLVDRMESWLRPAEEAAESEPPAGKGPTVPPVPPPIPRTALGGRS